MIMMPRLVRSFLINVLVAVVAQSAAAQTTIGILGDSISTGAVAHERVTFEASSLWQRMSGTEGAIEDDFSWQLVRPLPSRLEYLNSVEWLGQSALLAFSSRFLDVETHSWVRYFLEARGQTQAKVIMVAQDGGATRHMIGQARRLLKTNNGVWPEMISIAFHGNDLCPFDERLVTSAESYAQELERVLSLVATQGDSVDGRVHVVVQQPIGIVQLVTAKDILSKNVRAHGRVVTCKELNGPKQVGWVSPNVVTEMPQEGVAFFSLLPLTASARGLCPNLFASVDEKNADDRLAFIAGRQRIYREAIRTVASRFDEKANQSAKNKLRITIIEGSANLRLQPDDVAQDCFHLSEQGQRKLAKIVEEESR